MKIIWLGQAGLLFETPKATIMIDPYFSNSVEKINPNNYRRVEIDNSVFNIKPDIMIFTHNHLDHYDEETAKKFITSESSITVLSPFSVYQNVRKIGGLKNNYVLFDTATTWTEYGIEFTAVKAVHSDEYAIGVVINDGDKKYYVTGDTLYNEEILKSLPSDIYAVFLPINGVGNNMNAIDAEKFCLKISPQFAVPIHFSMFDELNASAFNYKNKIIPENYKEIKLI